MEIILLQSIDNLGYKHDIVNVKPGFGRNYLIPQGFGVIANDTNKKKLEKILEDVAAKENARIEDYREMAAKIKGQSVQIGVKSGTSGKIFGKVTNIQIANALKENFEVEIERKKIELAEEPKEIGTYTATIKFHPEVTEEISFELIKE
ncbi:MAG: 50S ribosomal protein L9 [Saprospiraceae bacterium]|nr:50S ribosomal protein L9 [Bacteroidia bacterium]NNF22096.1 50S ribosomal protein L9 [Saprospiraceae bacterium]NNK89422.1 50S ribosomal protein L9 [Saprospiraceae bacterium]